MSLQRYCDRRGDVPVEIDSVNVAVSPEIRLAPFHNAFGSRSPAPCTQ